VYSFPTNTTYAYYTWITMLLPYVKNEQIFQCPSSTDRFRYSPAGSLWAYGAYGGNRTWELAVPSTNVTYGFRSSASFQYPAETVFVGDAPTGMVYIRQSDGITDRHNNGANYAFFDGHAKWIAYQNAKYGPASPFWTGGF
jgi:prepilin-type processing-associated H-X9-DG protein